MAGRKRTRRRAKGEGSIFQRSDGSWQGAATTGYDEQGKQRKKYLYGKTQSEVVEKLQALKQQLADGSYSENTLTLAVYLQRWLQEKARVVKPSTLEQYEYCVNLKIVPRVGRIMLDKFTPLQVQTLVAEVADDGGVATANKCRVVLSNAYKQAVRLKLVTENPVTATDPLPSKRREMILWTPEQAERFLDLAQSHRLYALFYVAISTGMRRGELLGLRWQDVTDSTLKICQTIVKVKGKLVVGTPKTKKGKRTIHISPDVVEVLQEHRLRQLAEKAKAGEYWVKNNLVFASEVGTPQDPDNLKRVRYQLMDEAEVPRVRLHDLRHLHASIAIRHGTDPTALAARLGHSRPSLTLDVYTHPYEEARAKAIFSIQDFLPKRKKGKKS